MSVSSQDREALALRIERRLLVLLAKETTEDQDDIARELERELEKLGEWAAFVGGMTAQQYCTHVFLLLPAYIRPLLDAAVVGDFEPEPFEDARSLVDNLMCYLPSWTRARD